MTMTITLKTLTPLWTGGVDQTSDRLHETGLIGSLRWWYEALARGLGGYACDPTSEGRCEYDPKNTDPPEKQLCAACCLFGCSGWARTFRLRLLSKSGALVTDAIRKGPEISLQFIELRPMKEAERWLLARAIDIAANYGALGGRTALKPQIGPMGRDYGIVQVVSAPSLPGADVKSYLETTRRVTPKGAADLRWFFFVSGAFLWRRQMNALTGLSANGKSVIGNESYQQFLRGSRGDQNHNAVSKKLFSFRTGSGRIWGYAKDAPMRDAIIEQIRQTLGTGTYTLKTGEEVLHEL